MKTTNTLAIVNNVKIQCSDDAKKLVPIKPICEILGIDRKSQQEKIKDHPILGSVGGLFPLTGADAKTYEMFCLPLEYIFGWLFTINPDNVAIEARESVINYQLECYHSLFKHFTDRVHFIEVKQQEIDKQLEILEIAKANFKDAKNILGEAEARLKQVRKFTMDDFNAESRQLKLDLY